MKAMRVATRPGTGFQGHSRESAPEKIYFGIDELGARWGLGRSTIYDLINDGDLDTVKIRSRRLIPVASVAAYEAKIAQASSSK